MTAQRKRSTIIWFLLFFAGTLLSFPLLDRLGRPELERPILFSIVSLAVVVKIYPELYGRLLFWSAIVVLALMHLPLIFFLSWQNGWAPGPLIFLICLPDVALMIWIIMLLQKAVRRFDMSPK